MELRYGALVEDARLDIVMAVGQKENLALGGPQVVGLFKPFASAAKLKASRSTKIHMAAGFPTPVA